MREPPGGQRVLDVFAEPSGEVLLPAELLVEAGLEHSALVAVSLAPGVVMVRAASGSDDAAAAVRHLREEDVAIADAAERRRAHEARGATDEDVVARGRALREALGL